MARISDWHAPPFFAIREWIYVAIIVAVSYTIQFLSEILSGFVFVIGGVMLLSGFLAADQADSEYNKLQARGETYPMIAAPCGFLLMLSAVLFSVVLPSDDNSIKYMVGSFILMMFLIFPPGLDYLQTRKEDWLRIEVDGDYSLHFVRRVMTMIEQWFKNQKILFKNLGTIVQANVGEVELIDLIECGLHDISWLPTRCRYVFMVRTNSSKDSHYYMELKQALSNIVSEIEANEGIESYPQVKSTTCTTCGTNVSYSGRANRFYCKQCGPKEEHDVIIETEK